MMNKQGETEKKKTGKKEKNTVSDSGHKESEELTKPEQDWKRDFQPNSGEGEFPST